MISCDECQRRFVAVFDNEGNKDDEKLIDEHLKDCSVCRAFYEDMLRVRKQFASTDVPNIPGGVEQEVMQVVQADSQRRGTRKDEIKRPSVPLLIRFPRRAWVTGLAALVLLTASWIVSFRLAKKVEILTQELETSKREIALAREKEQLEEAQEKQQKAISALYFRMQELEERIDRSASPRSAFFPAEHNGL
ncbi:MAG: hypothetical protein JXM79_09790 [Sedimentisphaerales bacterium]|nr:hypothetical protein [Sedimentisphaerales bacterium]